jgi:hypothetical protein
MILAALLLALPQAPEAQITAAATTVEVGEPFELAIEIRHAADVDVELDPARLDDAWVLLHASGAVRRPAAEGRATTRVTWTVAALEPGEEALPALWASVDGAAAQAIPVLGSGVTVAGVLAPDEDQPRPPRGFRESAAPSAGIPWWIWPVTAVVAVGLGAALLWARRRTRTTGDAAPGPAQRLRALDPAALGDPRAVQAAYYEMTAALREAVDARLQRSSAAQTDEEWLAATKSELPESEFDLVADVLRQSAEVKYGTARPTHWGAQETLGRVLSVVEGHAAREEVRA